MKDEMKFVIIEHLLLFQPAHEMGTFDDDSFGSFVLDNKNIIDGRTNTRSKIFFMFLFSNAYSHIASEDVALKEIE